MNQTAFRRSVKRRENGLELQLVARMYYIAGIVPYNHLWLQSEICITRLLSISGFQVADGN